MTSKICACMGGTDPDGPCPDYPTRSVRPAAHTLTSLHVSAIREASASRHQPMWLPVPGPGAPEYVAGWVCEECDAQLNKAIPYPCEPAILWASLLEVATELSAAESEIQSLMRQRAELAARRTEAETTPAEFHRIGDGSWRHRGCGGYTIWECGECGARAAALLAQPETPEQT